MVRVGLVKVVPGKFAVEENWCALENAVRAHQGQNVDVFVSPEGFLDGYCSTEKSCDRAQLREVAETLNRARHVRKARALARELGAYLVFCFTEKRRRKLLNAAALIDRSGEVVGVYHKTHLQGHDLKYDRGQSLPVFETDFGSVGLMICADRRWPETVRTLRLQGAEVILNPTYGMHDERNKAMMRIRSYENGVFICFAHPRQALITAPDGSVAAELVSNVPGVLIHDLDLGLCDSSHLDDRQPDLYQGLVLAFAKPKQPAGRRAADVRQECLTSHFHREGGHSCPPRLPLSPTARPAQRFFGYTDLSKAPGTRRQAPEVRASPQTRRGSHLPRRNASYAWLNRMGRGSLEV